MDNHEVIHRNVSKLVGERPVAFVENHHNFAWMENHKGRTVIVHRKGATPSAEGVLGVIPGSMTDPALVVRGRGVTASLYWHSNLRSIEWRKSVFRGRDSKNLS